MLFRSAKVIPQKMRDFRLDRYNNNRPRRDYVRQSGSTNTQMVSTMFREPVRQVLEKIKNEPFFKWPNKITGDLTKHNQNLYCHYYQEYGHTTEDCRNLWDHLDQLVREGKLNHSCIILVVKGTKRVQIHRKMLLLGPLREQLMSSSLLLEGLDPTPPK